jgi:hypothetical protein
LVAGSGKSKKNASFAVHPERTTAIAMVPNPMTARRILRMPFGWCAVEPTSRLSFHVDEAQTQ